MSGKYKCISAYKIPVNPSKWINCPNCGLKPLICEFNNGSSTGCGCDATPITGAMDKIKKLLEKNIDFDILFVGWIAGHQSKVKEIDNDFIFLERFWGTHSYIVNPNSVDKVLSVIGNPTNHIDKRISDLVRTGKIKGIFSREKIFNQNKEFKTQIPKK